MSTENKWTIKECSFLSLKELNDFIYDQGIQPEQVLKYSVTFEQFKQCMKYVITYWEQIENKKE